MPRNVTFDDDLDEEINTARIPEEPQENDPLRPFLDDGTIAEVLGEVKSGKEGTVYACRANPSLGCRLVAAKVFRAREQRTFRNHALYREGVVVLNKRDARAARKKTAWGRTFEEASWKCHEYEVLKVLFRAGADVPEPLRLSEHVLLMEYLGDERGAAPKLRETTLDTAEALPIYERLMANVELFLSNDIVHGDLSAYNVLYWRGQATVIDFPQAVDARTNRNALPLLQRDLKNICRYFAGHGIRSDAESIGRGLWRRYMRAQL